MDIKGHRWFKNFDWNKCEKMELAAIYKPTVKSEGDTSNYSDYPDSPDLPKALKPQNDPFLDW